MSEVENGSEGRKWPEDSSRLKNEQASDVKKFPLRSFL